jgi:hypothetical protein
MATRRFKSATMKFGVPLPVPASRCYGKHGKAYAHTPPRHPRGGLPGGFQSWPARGNLLIAAARSRFFPSRFNEKGLDAIAV